MIKLKDEYLLLLIFRFEMNKPETFLYFICVFINF